MWLKKVWLGEQVKKIYVTSSLDKINLAVRFLLFKHSCITLMRLLFLLALNDNIFYQTFTYFTFAIIILYSTK